jgi:hypothetical protein
VQAHSEQAVGQLDDASPPNDEDEVVAAREPGKIVITIWQTTQDTGPEAGNTSFLSTSILQRAKPALRVTSVTVPRRPLEMDGGRILEVEENSRNLHPCIQHIARKLGRHPREL